MTCEQMVELGKKTDSTDGRVRMGKIKKSERTKRLVDIMLDVAG